MSHDKNTKAAFHWIVNILKKFNTPFQIAGGLAAIVYGANRPLEDIDIDIPEEYFSLIKEEVKDFIIYGPAQFKDETWDLMLMTQIIMVSSLISVVLPLLKYLTKKLTNGSFVGLIF